MTIKSMFPLNPARILFFSMLLFLFGSCNSPKEESVEVDFSADTPPTRVESPGDSLAILSVAIAPVISPKESFVYYNELFDYLATRMNMKVEFRQRMSYQEVNNMLERNLVDMAFICTGSYMEASDRMDILVAPIINGEPQYQAYIITNVNSGIREFKDLKDRSFAFTDPLSTAGRVYPLKRIMDMGEDTTSFFKNTVYSSSHDISIQMVSRNLIAGAAVSSLIYNNLEKTQPELISNLRIIDQSEPFGSPPIVTSLLLAPEKKQQIRQLFLEMHHDPQGREILDKLMVDQFILVGDTLYDSLRKMTQQVWP
ncbi:MAG: phosphate/phosphite/phosphonate ABC transporter substrate-binding protein [Bacteroidales bacterium]